MGETTAISWTDHTHNPWWGCWKIAPECLNCYADDLANRYAPGHWGRTSPRRFFADSHVNELTKWNRKAKRDGIRRRVFVGSMCDWAEIHPVVEIAARQDAVRKRFFEVAYDCTALDFLMLTKRPEDAARLVPWGTGSPPWAHFWIGTSAGTVESLRSKVPALRMIPAAVRFISCEPLLEGIPADEWDCALDAGGGGPIHWLIVGNESGHKRRPAETEWVRTARDVAARHEVAFHFKQWVEPNGHKVHLPVLDGVQHAAFPGGAE